LAVTQAGDTKADELRIDFRMGTHPESGRRALTIHVDGMPDQVSLAHVAAVIVGSLQAILGAEVVESVVQRSH
jgi:hypothetical protein